MSARLYFCNDRRASWPYIIETKDTSGFCMDNLLKKDKVYYCEQNFIKDKIGLWRMKKFHTEFIDIPEYKLTYPDYNDFIKIIKEYYPEILL